MIKRTERVDGSCSCQLQPHACLLAAAAGGRRPRPRFTARFTARALALAPECPPAGAARAMGVC